MKNSYLFIIFALLSAGLYQPLTAQVTIGGDKAPESFSVLELISNQKSGMRLPQMTTIERNTMTAGFGTLAATEARGLTIYNTDLECMEYWDGVKWISGAKVSADDCADACDCDGDGFYDCACFAASPPANCETDDSDPCSSPVSGLSATVSNANVVVGTTVTITVTGAGTINNLSVDGGTTRISGNTITVRPVSIGVNTYTVTVNNCPAQTVEVSVTATACIAIEKVEITGCANYMFTYQSLTLTANKTPAGSPPSYYQWYINGNPMEGATTDTYVIDGSTILTSTDGQGNNSASLQITCAMGNACGIKISSVYPLQVMNAQMGTLTSIHIRTGSASVNQVGTLAHVNLGAEFETDPCNMLGDLYQWGRYVDGHEKRTSQTYSGTVSGDANFDAYGQVASSHTAFGKFILPTVQSDWRTPQKDSLWIKKVSQSTYKQPSDPCPSGWRVANVGGLYGPAAGAPTAATVNTWAWATYGFIIQDAAFLPAAGYRGANGVVYSDKTEGYYWTGDIAADITPQAYYVKLTENLITPSATDYRGKGYSVRCYKLGW